MNVRRNSTLLGFGHSNRSLSSFYMYFWRCISHGIILEALAAFMPTSWCLFRSPFSLCVLGGGSGLCFNMMLWISPPHCASPSVSLWFHSTQLNPSHSHRKALVLSGGVWLALIVNPWRWPGSVCVMVGHLLLKPGPNVSL